MIAVSLTLLVALVAQEPARPVPAAPQISPDGRSTPNPECSIRKVAEELAGESAHDCGLGWDDDVRAESDPEALACVLDSLESGKDFLFHNKAPGMDSLLITAVVSRSRRLYVLNWDSNSMGGPGYLERLVLYEPESWEVREAKEERREWFAGRLVPKGQHYPRFRGDRHQFICRSGERVLQDLPIDE